MAYFQTKKPNLGKFWSDLQLKLLVYFMVIRSILWPLGILCGPLVYFMVIWYTFHVWDVVPRKIWQPCFTTPKSVEKI
jgi:hypothetical protein